MYMLDQDNGGSAIYDIPCSPGDQLYGCTMKPDDLTYAYPFPSSTITVGIDDTSGSDNVYYEYPYLWDLVTTELGVHIKGGNALPNNGYVPHAAIEAQAIASRTFTYHRDEYVGVIDNSTRYHAYIPFSYEVLLDEGQKEDVRDGTLRRFYLTESNTSYPIDAQHGADAPDPTVEGFPTLVSNINYLQSVADPISAVEGVLNGNGQGLSSNGSRRWSYGYQSAYPNITDGLWSVQWDDAFQILPHYYTGIHIRNANNGNAVITPDHRWVPLEIQAPVLACVGRNTLLTVRLQNSGTQSWPEQSVIVNITHTGTDPVAAADADAVSSTIAEEVFPGGDVEIELTIQPLIAGINHYYIDLYSNAAGGFFSHQPLAWPRYELWEIAAVDCPEAAEGIFLPIVLQQGAVMRQQ